MDCLSNKKSSWPGMVHACNALIYLQVCGLNGVAVAAVVVVVVFVVSPSFFSE